MTDRRLSPAIRRPAAEGPPGAAAAGSRVEGEAAALAVPLADLRAAPGGARARQLLWGEAVTVFERRAGWAFVQAARDGYAGYLEEAALGPAVAATHTVAAPATHLYSAPDIRAPEVCGLSFGARLRVVSASGAFFETDAGLHVPKPHLRPANRPFADPATVAQLFFGAPYLWGGNSIRGIDCSGLVQAALLACGIACPGDSDLQAAHPGFADLAPGAALARGDLVFWRGHVGLMVDPGTLIHANAHHMAVAYEPLAEAEARIAAAGGGPVTARRRPARP